MLIATYAVVAVFLFIFSMATPMQGDRLKDRITDSIILGVIWPIVSVGVLVYALHCAYTYIKNALKRVVS